jgi:hypothetical protein
MAENIAFLADELFTSNVDPIENCFSLTSTPMCRKIEQNLVYVKDVAT